MINPKKRLLLIEFVENVCEECHKKKESTDLQIHKINPELGYSNFRNLKVVCKKCHDIYSSALRKAYRITS